MDFCLLFKVISDYLTSVCVNSDLTAPLIMNIQQNNIVLLLLCVCVCGFVCLFVCVCVCVCVCFHTCTLSELYTKEIVNHY